MKLSITAAFLPFKSQVVRDLAWACFGPDLIAGYQNLTNKQQLAACHLTLTEQREQWLVALDCNPSPLINHLQQLNSRRLGHYFEALWQFFILQDPQLTLVAHNLPVHRHQKTLGEFDILYNDRETGHHYHLELAIKFYLDAGTTLRGADAEHADHSTEPDSVSDTLANWLGPNRRDRLDKKLNRLVNHQIALSDHPEAKQCLHSLGINSLGKEITVKGMLFYAGEHHQSHCAQSTHWLHPHHQHGLWYHWSSFARTINTQQHWLILDRQRWISPVRLSAPVDSCLSSAALLAQLENHFQSNQQAVMICAMHSADHGTVESARYFIVHDQWNVIIRKDR